MSITVEEFVHRWQHSTLTEKSASQSHFIELCQLLGQPTPAQVDNTGEHYTFEKGVSASQGGDGWADVWKRGHFGWEYKGKHKDLAAAYGQLLRYHDLLDNPPLLVVCDMDRFEVHTKFTGTVKLIYRFRLADLLTNQPSTECPLPPLEVLRAVFNDPSRLRPQTSTAKVTEDAAAEFIKLAESLRGRGLQAQRVGHFLMRLLFCLFAEDIALLPPKLFSRLIEATRLRPADFQQRLAQLFTAMARGGSFGADDIKHFNGDLFTDGEAIELTIAELDTLFNASKLDWSSIEPAIFGTLFERILDESKRSQLGAHYTSREDILLIIEPVLMAPLRRRWLEVKAKAEKPGISNKKLKDLLLGFADEISKVRVLDPACGSGNFLYVSLKLLLDLLKDVSIYASTRGIPGLLVYQVTPRQLYGIEKNVYAHELASIVVWIGYLQWLHDNGSGEPPAPVLQRLDNIRCMDAILAHDSSGHPIEPEWPAADVIVGNPPFLGDKKMRAELGDVYVDELRKLYEDRVPGGADLVTYWFEKAREEIAQERAQRAGLLATNSISMMGNRPVLKRIKETGDIFFCWSDRPWVLDGADIRVSMIGIDDGAEKQRQLDGNPVNTINPDLTEGADVSRAVQLQENEGLCFLGLMKGGPFDIDESTARSMLNAPPNPNGKSNSDVVRKRLIGADVVRQSSQDWIIDFFSMSVEEAALYELPFEYVKRVVKPVRETSRDRLMRENWWLHGRSRPALRAALHNLSRCIVTPEVAKHRIFVWMTTSTVPDHTLHVIARQDDYFFGLVHSRLHEMWSLAQGSWMGVGNDPRYSSSRTFETYPFPWPPGKEPQEDPRVQAIAAAAKDLVAKRDAWLNPPPSGGSPSAQELKKRTLTNLYNQRPQWLADAHRALDRAVFAAYGWSEDPEQLPDTTILERLLALNQQRAGAASGKSARPARKKSSK